MNYLITINGSTKALDGRDYKETHYVEGGTLECALRLATEYAILGDTEKVTVEEVKFHFHK
jgi:hypothetical protein